MAVFFAVIGTILVFLLFRAASRERAKQKSIDNEFLLNLEESRLAYRYLDIIDDVARHASSEGYAEKRGEKLLGSYSGATNFDTKEVGSLFVTTKAIVFSNDRLADRITWTSIRAFHVKRDGLEILRTRGWRKAYKCDDPSFLALAEAAFLRGSA